MKFPIKSLAWVTVATLPSQSPIHRDAGGFCTYLRVHAGYKMWFMHNRITNPRGPPLANDLVNTDMFCQDWEGLLLGPGHVLYVSFSCPPSFTILIWIC